MNRFLRSLKVAALLIALTVGGGQVAVAQFAVTTNGGSGLAGTYPNLAAAITALNGATITSPVVITCPAGTETSPAGGYSITALGTAVNTITIAGNGAANSIITAPNPAGTAGALTDAIFKLVGADYVTIQGFAMNENGANTTTAAATNNMVEWGVALLYNGTTNGAQNNTIQNNAITLNRTYQNTFGIYSNSTHSATAATTSATATTTAGGNSGLKIYGNTISNVNMGMVVIGPTAAADHNTGIDIGGVSAGTGNTLTNFGTTGTISSYANVSGTVNGILVRNSNGYNVSYNGITSSVGGTTSGTLNGIQQTASSSAPTGTFTNTISNNTINLQSAVAAGAINGINIPSGSATTTSVFNITNNNYTALNHTVAASGAITAITTASTHLTTSISGNTFTNLTCNSTGSFTFISNSYTMPAAGSSTANGNSIVTAFNKTGAGGTITLVTSGASSPNGSTESVTNNNFSNITVTGATTIAGIVNTNGLSSSPTKTFTGNTLSNWTGGTSSITGISIGYVGATTSSVSSNTITNITGQAGITGITIGSSFSGANPLNIANNTVTGLTSTGTGGAVTGITCSNTSATINFNNNTIGALSSTGASAVQGMVVSGATANNVFANKVYDLSGSNASSTVSGITISGSTTATVYNNLIGNLSASAANAANPVNGLNITGGTTANVFFNTVRLAASSSGALFGSSALVFGTTTTLNLQNNILVNLSTPSGTGNVAALRRTSGTAAVVPANYSVSSNTNDFYAIGAAAYLYVEGTTTLTNGQQSIAALKAFFVNRDQLSISENPTFLSTVGSNSNFLHIDPATPTFIESGGATVGGITTDYDGDIRGGTPDIGADEFTGSQPSGCTLTPLAGTSSVTGGPNACAGLTKSLTNAGHEVATGITYQWQVSLAPGGPYSDVVGGTGATTTSYTTGVLAPGTYYYSLLVTCTNSSLFANSVEASIVVNTPPTVLVNGVAAATGSYCTPGGTPVALAATGASTYAWSPASGLSATTGANVTATPGTTTTYTVTGTDGNGCTGTATATITVTATPQNVTASATPTSICSGSTSNLTSSAVLPQGAGGYAFAASTGTFTPISGGTSVATSTSVADFLGDTKTSVAIPLGFTFYYGSASYTSVKAMSDGFLSFNASATTTATNNLATSAATRRPLVAPLWDDLSGASGSGAANYITTGAPGSRVFTIEWLNWLWNFGATGSTISFQVKLYEADGRVEFIYRQEAGAYNAGTTGGASIGLTDVATGAGNYLSLNGTGASPTASNATETTSLNTKPATDQIYTFTPLAPSFSWAPSGDVVSPTSQNTATNALTATTTFTVTATNSGCSATATATVTVNPLVCGALTTAGTACVGSQTVTANPSGGGAPYTYAWTEDGNAFGGNTQTITASVGSHTYVCTVTDACTNSCSSSLLVTTNALPVVTVTPNSGTYCTPAGTAVALAAGGATTYAWSPAGGLDATTGANVNASPSATTTYTVTGTDGNGCVNTATAAITVAATPQNVTASANPTSVCANGTSTLTASASAQNTSALPNAYSFAGSTGTYTAISGTTVANASTDDGGQGNLPIGFTFNYNGTAQTVFSAGANGLMILGDVTANYISGTNNYPFTNALASTVNRIAPFWEDNNCTGGSIQYLTTGTVGNRVLTVQWTGMHTGSSGSATNPTINVQAKLYESSGAIEFIYGSTSAALTGTTASIGISGASGNFISVTPLSPANTSTTSTATENTGISSATNIPTGTTYTFTPPQFALTYAWSLAGDVVSPNSQTTLTNAITATTTYTVTVSNNGCPATATTTVTVNPPITAASITGNLAFCTGGSTTLTATPADGVAPYTYLWSPGNQTTASIVVSAPGNYSCQVTDACSGSVNTGTVTVVENPLPTVTIPTVVPANGAICGGVGNVQMTATGATSYAWLPVTGLDNAAIANPTSTATVTTTYTVTGTDGNGCTNTATQVVNVGNNPVISSVTATPAAICVIGNSQLNVVATEEVTTNHAGAAITITASGNSAPYPSPVVVSALPGVITNIKVNLNNLSHAFPNDIDMVLFGPTGAHSIIFTDAIGGTGGGVTGRNYTFQIGATALPTTGYPASGTYGVVNGGAYGGTGTPSAVSSANLGNFLGTSPNGTWSLYVFDDFTGDAGSIGSWSLDITVGAPVSTYSWSPATFLNSTTISNPEAQNINATTTYTVTATSAIGCTAQGNTTVTVNPLPTVTCPGNSSVCIDAAAFALTGGSPVGGTYSGTGVSAGNFNAASAGAGTHTITYSYTDGNSCTNTCTFDITVNALPVITCPANSSVCIDAAAFALTGGSPAGGTYSGTGVSAGNFNPATAGVGTHTITYSYTDGNGCTNTPCTFTITVNALPVITCPANSSVCIDAAAFALTGGSPAGGTYSGTGVSAGNFNPATAGVGTHTITYSYTDGNGCTNTPCTFDITVNALPVMTCPGNSSVCIDAAAFALTGGSPVGGTYSGAGVSAGNFNPASAGAGTHSITYSYTDGNTCTNTCTFTITVNALPVMTCPADQTVAANAPAFTLTGGAPAGGTYSGPGVSAGQFDASVAGSGNHLITYSYTDGNGCTNSCTFTISVGNMVLVLETDASADVVTWEVRTTPGNVLSASGGPYAASTTYTLPFYLANGDYVLSVFDSGGDGLCCMNGTGGFILRTSGGARFIDANNSGIFTSTASVTLGFTLPMGANFNQLTASRCDRENYLPSDFIQCGEDVAVTAQYGVTNSTSGYQFWIFDPNGGYSRRVLITHATASTTFPAGPARASFLRLNQLTTNPIPYDKVLNVRIRSLVAGVYNNFGPACRIKVDLSTNCPTTQLLNNVADPRHSCGITGVMLNGSRTLHAVAVAAANRYQFEFAKSGYLRRISSPTSSLNLTVWNTLPLQYGFTYNVKVRASFDNGANYCPFGAICQITTAAGPENQGHSMETTVAGEGLQMWPNPNGEGRVYLRLEGLNETTELVTVDIYDLMGAKVQTATLVAGAGVLNESLDLSNDIARGVYVVNVVADGQVFTKRLVVE